MEMLVSLAIYLISLAIQLAWWLFKKTVRGLYKVYKFFKPKKHYKDLPPEPVFEYIKVNGRRVPIIR